MRPGMHEPIRMSIETIDILIIAATWLAGRVLHHLIDRWRFITTLRAEFAKQGMGKDDIDKMIARIIGKL